MCASGTSWNVITFQPRRKSRYAPKETRAQKGSFFGGGGGFVWLALGWFILGGEGELIIDRREGERGVVGGWDVGCGRNIYGKYRMVSIG